MTSKIKVDNISDQNDNNIINESGDVITVGASGDTVAVAGNIVKSNAYQAADGGSIISQSGTTITIGASGDTVSLASGASQSGFGRSGSVDWQTSIKTSNFTAVSGEGYFVNTTSGAVTVTLPASPSAGAIVAIKDYANTADTNAITIARNSSPIDGGTDDVDLITEGLSVVLVYADSTKGWLVVESGQKSDLVVPTFISASGGNTVATSGNFKIHTFTGPGTFTVCSVGNSAGSNTVDYLVIAGGGGGGTSGNSGSSHGGAGGGAGGYRFSDGTASGCFTTAASPLTPLGASALPVSAQGYPIVVGSGGAGRGHPSTSPGTSGNDSSFSTITSGGGGGGGSRTPTGGSDGGNGGSGGGANTGSTAGSGNTPPVSPPQGNDGGPANNNGAGAGGGAGAAGQPSPGPVGGNGGAGITSCITGSPVGRGGGGGGGSCSTAGTGSDGGGDGQTGGAHGQPGTANTGGGGGGSSHFPNSSDGGSGGSGIVIIRYRFQ